MDLSQYRASEPEVERVADLFSLIQNEGGEALDVGARDGFISLRLAERFRAVTALDLELPRITHPHITCVAGDVTRLPFEADAFDVVLCAEVLEHLEGGTLKAACEELCRVSKKLVLIGVPFEQDTRLGRMNCASCGAVNPPWGHVSTFTEARLRSLFSPLTVRRVTHIGMTRERTNFISAFLMDCAGNPYGTYFQEEPCVSCGKELTTSKPFSIRTRILAKAAVMINDLQRPLLRARPNWLHVLFEKA